MKRVLCVLLLVSILLTGCTAGQKEPEKKQEVIAEERNLKMKQKKKDEEVIFNNPLEVDEAVDNVLEVDEVVDNVLEVDEVVDNVLEADEVQRILLNLILDEATKHYQIWKQIVDDDLK